MTTTPPEVNDILARLNRKFGIRSLDLPELTLDGEHFTLMPLSDGQTAYTVSLASNLSESVVDAALILETATVAMAVVAINKIPIFELFGISTEGINIADKMNPPETIRQEGCSAFFDYLREHHIRDGLVNFLYREYDEQTNKHNQDMFDRGNIRYMCVNKHVSVLVGREKPYFCVDCGELMSPITEDPVSKADALPLP